MRKIVFTILLAPLFVACDSDDNPVISPNLDMQEEPIFNENKTFKCDGGSTYTVGTVPIVYSKSIYIFV